LWLHTTASTFNHQFIKPIPADVLPAVGSVINTTSCPGPQRFQEQPNAKIDLYANCQHKDIVNPNEPQSFPWANASIINEGTAVIGNRSETSSVTFVEGKAVLLPKSLPNNVKDLTLTTFALDVSCGPVTDCVPNTQNFGNGTLLYCPSFTPPQNLSKSGILQVNHTTSAIIFGTSLDPSEGYSLDSILNPAGALVVLSWPGVVPDTVNLPTDAKSTSGWYVWNVPRTADWFGLYVTSCQISVYDATIAYSSTAGKSDTSPQLSLVGDPTLADFNTTSALLGALDPFFEGTLAEGIRTAVQPSLSAPDEELLSVLTSNLSLSLLGYASPLTMRAAASAGSFVTLLPVSRYPLAPLCAVLALLYGYALITSMICIGTVFLRTEYIGSDSIKDRKTRIELVREKLTSVREVVMDRFGPQAASTDTRVMPEQGGDAVKGSLSDNEVFVEEKDAERLGVGIVSVAGIESDAGNPLESEERISKRRPRQFKVDVVERILE
jgi:hypothetical protein